MICYNSCDNINKEPCVIALGNFDGVHRGHVHLLSKACEYARSNGLGFGIYTFDVHPKTIGKINDFRLLSSRQQQIRMFEKTGADFVYFEDFVSVRDYDKKVFTEYLKDKFMTEAVFCGENFRYAKNASGNSKTLCEDMEKLKVQTFEIELLKVDGENVSSSRIREKLESGNIEKANELLGYEFSIEGKVLHGNSIGHTLGFPTVNLRPDSTLVCPKFSVYASKIHVDGKEYKGVTNIGVKPTVLQSKKEVLAETNIFGFRDDIYGKHIEVSLCKMLRSERKFDSFDELKTAVDNDIKNAMKYFGE